MGAKFSKETMVTIVEGSSNIGECLDKMGLKKEGGNYQTFHYYRRLYGLDISHFNSYQKIENNLKFGKKYPVDHFLTNEGYPIGGSKLLKRLIAEGYKLYKCEQCGNIEWNGQRIPLELHHINGDHYDNRMDNLEVLCPNCHAQTDNYRGKNQKNYQKKKYFCIECGKETQKRSKSGLCVQCEHKRHYRCQHPDKETLLQLLQQGNFTSVAERYGVTDNSVRKWCKGYGMPTNASAYK